MHNSNKSTVVQEAVSAELKNNQPVWLIIIIINKYKNKCWNCILKINIVKNEKFAISSVISIEINFVILIGKPLTNMTNTF